MTKILQGPQLIGAPKLSAQQVQMAEILKETLALVLEGEISAFGMVVCMKTGYSTLIGGNRATDLYTGCGSLQRRILNLIEGSGEQKINSLS